MVIWHGAYPRCRGPLWQDPRLFPSATGTRDVVALLRHFVFHFLPLPAGYGMDSLRCLRDLVGSQDAIRCCFVWSVFRASPIVLLRRSFQVVDVRRRDVSLNGCLQCIFGADVWHTCSPISQSHNCVSDQLLLQFPSRPCDVLFKVALGFSCARRPWRRVFSSSPWTAHALLHLDVSRSDQRN